MAALAGVCVLTVSVATLTGRAGEEPVAAGPAQATVWQSPVVSGPVSSGNAPGCGSGARARELAAVLSGPDSVRAEGGVAAIEVFEAAYYLSRDARRARSVVAVAAAIPDVADIQAGIDSLQAGTTYCARITALAPGLYAVDVHENRPDHTENVWRQHIATSAVGDGTQITAITHL
ncbi:hypothetical protein IU474_16825 [Nocardia otitidiscaviarum]|uniref:hypothetical protein n=1 Tax=Nocardia otitidiscaviarum TaxID=1823 RepID=UPI0018934836|nr:hypothetical protein [Nocardia otitidiscaviarum]MBF6238715.1 hypothetical protein [Nocardia otitidiscaviarum]